MGVFWILMTIAFLFLGSFGISRMYRRHWMSGTACVIVGLMGTIISFVLVVSIYFDH